MKYFFLYLFIQFHFSLPLLSQQQEIVIDAPLSTKPLCSGSSIKIQQYNGPKIVLALSGGGARGFAHIGVLKVLEQQAIPVNAICGTSIGAIIGGLSAVGFTAAEIESLAFSIRWDEIISNAPQREQLYLSQKKERSNHLLQLRFKGLKLSVPGGYSTGHHLTALLRQLFLKAPGQLTSDFLELEIPFIALASDMISGRQVKLTNGSLSRALRASMAIPLLFTPVKMDSMLLVDGGLIQNLPVTEARSLGADIVICVDATSRLRSAAELDAPWKIADQVTSIMQQEKMESEFKKADIGISPLLPQITNTDFNLGRQIIEAGQAAAIKMLPRLDSLLGSHAYKSQNLYRLNDIRYRGFVNTDPYEILSGMQPVPADILISEEKICWMIQDLTQTGFYQDIKVVIDSTAHILTFTVSENPVIDSFQITGNKMFTDSLLHALVNVQTRQVLNTHNLQQGLKRLIQHYKNHDFGLARIDSLWIDANGLFLEIDEGLIKNISLTGNTHSRPFIILRELSMKPGSLFKSSRALHDIENIYSTGLFDEISMSYPDKHNGHTLGLKVSEHENLIMQMGMNYSLNRRVKGFIKILRDNILGFGSQGSVFGLAGQKDLLFKSRLWSNRFFYTYLSYDFSITLARQEFNFYNNFKQAGSYARYNREMRIKLKQQMKRFGALSLEIAWQNIEILPINGLTVPDESNSVVSFKIQSEVDTRDRLPFPESGKHHLFEYETAGSWLRSETAYTKLYSSMQNYFPINSRLNFNPAIKWGTSDISTPFSKQFFLGGKESFIGLPERALFGRRFINLNFALRGRLPALGTFKPYLTLRYDLAGIWSSYSKIQIEDFQHAIGIILSLNTPAGPFSLSSGWVKSGSHHFCFTFGHQF